MRRTAGWGPALHLESLGRGEWGGTRGLTCPKPPHPRARVLASLLQHHTHQSQPQTDLRGLLQAPDMDLGS